ncbi:hypothetical protein QRD02_07565 [Aequorivita sp. SDUM287046]|uniref:Uncharacterized protein n=1 Tax=Aequorivita aurantiaca TaxID=3053356 RepID=A0ABT8DJW5_9FLAO|nr:hypothetical protein [Aequorivita aurantiaca]MDN3724236.1 hypothetical protein [Aequorivita aurantiaca]
MQQFNFKEGKNLMYVAARAFPDDIFLAHQELHSLVRVKTNREYFGIAFADKNGKIQYKAAVTEIFKGEAAVLGMETCLLKKGNYPSISIPSTNTDVSEAEKSFIILLIDPSKNNINVTPWDRTAEIFK